MHPNLFMIPIIDWPVRTYGVMVLIGFLLALYISSTQAKREGRFYHEVQDYAFWALLGGMLGAWMLYVIVNYREMFFEQPFVILSSGIKFPACLAIWRGGAHYVGGFIGAIVTAVIYCRQRGLKWAPFFDALALGVPVAMIFARTGCIAQGCCFGAPFSWLPLGMIYEAGSYPYRMMAVEGFRLGLQTPLLFPSEIAEGVGSLIIFAALVVIRGHKRAHGQVFMSYIFLYSILRFALEYVRGDTERGFWLSGLLTTSQIVSLAGVVIAIAWWFFHRPEWKRHCVPNTNTAS
ncbi:MAG: prolipoprotein diacylglyceryl transferase family protein [Myxococcota bacterium]